METKNEQSGKGLVVEPDDLQIGQFYAVLGPKNGADDPFHITGAAFMVMAINLPFLVGRTVINPLNGPVIIDTRYLTFMKVTKEFVDAQRPD